MVVLAFRGLRSLWESLQLQNPDSLFGWEPFSPGDESTQAQLRVPWLVLGSPEDAKEVGHN